MAKHGSGLFDLANEVALVTGGNGGIGRGIALGLAEAGAAVVIAARDAKKTDGVVGEIEALGARALGVRCDVTLQEDVAGAVAAAREAFGRLTILVNNAGIAGGGPPEQIEDAVWAQVIDTNLTAAFRCARAAHPHFVEAGHGKVINIGSEYSLFGSAMVLPYSASKGGLIQLTKSLAVAWAAQNIQVNAIVPGWIRTDMTAGVQRMEDFYRQIVQRTPAGRFGDPEELAGAGVFLASRASDFVTGVVLPVDGGYAAA